MLLPGKKAAPTRLIGSLLGILALAGIFSQVLQGDDVPPTAYYYVFSAIAIAAAVRVITHSRPVYSALYFVMVVLSTAGLLVLLDAEFMAFAMIIIYGGAILVTYMFVIMLATLPQTADQPNPAEIYDTHAREPLLAVLAGFLLLAAVGNLIMGTQDGTLPTRPGDSATAALVNELSHKFESNDERALAKLQRILRQENVIASNQFVYGVEFDKDTGAGRIDVKVAKNYEDAIGIRPNWIEIDEAIANKLVSNIDLVGLNLFKGHTLGIELAGVILLLAMVGAVVIARQANPAPEATEPAEQA
jgi:NADH-quinone oxidoreductase subunit J